MQRIKGLLAIVGEGAAIFRAKLLNRFRLPEQSTCRKYRKHCMTSNESLSSKYVNSHSLTRIYWATSSLSNRTRAERMFQERRRRRVSPEDVPGMFPYARRERDFEKFRVEKWVDLADSALKKKKPPSR